MRIIQSAALNAAIVLALFCAGPIAMSADMDGVMMQNGKMMMMKAGKAAGPMTSEMTMSNGTTVMADGRNVGAELIALGGDIRAGGRRGADGAVAGALSSAQQWAVVLWVRIHAADHGALRAGSCGPDAVDQRHFVRAVHGRSGGADVGL